MSLWKYSLELVTRELDLTKKKEQALDELFASKKISQATHEYLGQELAATMTDLNSHLKSLMDKMEARAQELDKQISMLELFLASIETHHAAGEISNEAYEAQNKAIILGLETTKQELKDIKSSLSKIVSASTEESVTSIAPEMTEKEKPVETIVAESVESEAPTLAASSIQPCEEASAVTDKTIES